MKKRFWMILAIFALLTLGAACWQAREAATLNDRLLAIDKETQQRRLVELSLPRVQAEMNRLLAEERAKLGAAPDFSLRRYPMPAGGKADFNCGFFLLTPDGLETPEGEDDFAGRLQRAKAVIDTIRRKALNPAAPVYDPTRPAAAYDARTRLPVFGVYDAGDADDTAPLQLKGTPSPFFAWHERDNVVYMRTVPTTHGASAEGFVIDPAKLAEHLLPLVEPALKGASIRPLQLNESANLSPLPLVLLPGDDVDLPDTAARREALRGTVVSAWVIAALSITILFGLLAFYARLERRRSDFVSAVTHELRTPLTSFTLMTEMLRSGTLSPEKQAEYHETLYNESRRLGHLVENVLAFARLSRGKVRGRQDAGPCRSLLDTVFDKTAARLKAAGFRVAVTHDTRTDLITLRTDLLSLEQIFTNLADNAVKYAATAEHPAVNITVVRKHRELAIRFADNGGGMAEEVKGRLFRPFSRSAKAVQGRKPGVGLGLALSRDVARSVGGELSLEKSDAKGTTFLLTLPLD